MLRGGKAAARFIWKSVHEWQGAPTPVGSDNPTLCFLACMERVASARSMPCDAPAQSPSWM